MSDGAVYTEKQVRRWLGFLARNMQSRGQTIFLVENLQPTWLANSNLRNLYFVVSRTFVYVLSSLSVFFFCVAISFKEVANWSEPCVNGAITAAISVASCLFLEIVLQTKLRRQIPNDPHPLSVTRTIPLLFLLMQFLIVWTWLSVSGLSSKVISGFSFACPVLNTAIAASGARRLLGDDIKPGRLLWSWKTFASAFAIGWTWATALTIGFTAIAVLAVATSSTLLVVVFILAVCIAVLVFVYRLARAANDAFQGGTIELKTRPNAGIWLSLRSGSLVLCMMLVIVGVLDWLRVFLKGSILDHLKVDDVMVLGMFLLTPIVLSRVFIIGGIAFIDHFVLRALLALFGYAPFRYVRFLDDVANGLGFLQKAGGGYVFMHRNLMEYFTAEVREETLV